MSVKKNKEIDLEILLKEYELNMSDHDRKEKMAWLASTLYYTFCIAVIGFMFSNDNIKGIIDPLCFAQRKIIFVIIFLILFITFFYVFLFVWYQYNRKEKSKANIEVMKTFFEKNVDSKEMKEMLEKIHDEKTPFGISAFLKHGFYGLIILFFLIKITVIFMMLFINCI